MTVDGMITDEVIEEEAIAGADVILTIDSKLQRISEVALAANIEKIKSGGFGTVYNATGGSCVVMNVRTGRYCQQWPAIQIIIHNLLQMVLVKRNGRIVTIIILHIHY